MRGVVYGACVRLFSRARSRISCLRFSGWQTLVHQASAISTWAVVASCAAFLAGCNATESRPVDFARVAQGHIACASPLGSYALPKTNLRAELKRTAAVKENNTIKAPATATLTITPVQRADRALQFCLDHISSAFAADTIKIAKSGAFLQSVFVNATDRTVQIVATLLRTAMIAATGNPLYGRSLFGDVEGTLVDVEFDPFDRAETARANRILRQAAAEWGFCVYVPYANPALAGEKYCENPDWTSPSGDKFARMYEAYSRSPIDPKTPGLLYRPRPTYPIVIYQKPPSHGSKSKGAGAKVVADVWKIARIEHHPLENVSPVLSLGIERAVFSQRISSFVFNNGVLQTACVSKGSEIEGFVEIPLDISRALVALPAQIATVQFGRRDSEAKLAQAQALAINAQNAAIASILSGVEYASPSGVKEPAATTAVKLDIQKALNDLPSGTTAPAVGDDKFFSESYRKVCQETP